MKELVADLLGELNLASRQLERMQHLSILSPLEYMKLGIATMGHINNALQIAINMQEILLVWHRPRRGREVLNTHKG
jgi:hypothetical protein